MSSDIHLDTIHDADELFEDNTLIGEYTEEAVRGLFERSGYSMTPFGIEHLFKKDLDFIALERDAGHEHQRVFVDFLRSFPDFVALRRTAQHLGHNEIFPVEVKFRRERTFPGGPTTIRLRLDTVKRYKTYWPSTLLVVVCYHRRTVIATRIHKLDIDFDKRVPIGLSNRRSWFYDIERHDFLPLGQFVKGYFSQDDVESVAADVIAWANEVRGCAHV